MEYRQALARATRPTPSYSTVEINGHVIPCVVNNEGIVTSISIWSEGKYRQSKIFFTQGHIGVKGSHNGNSDKNWIPSTLSLPMTCAPRSGLSGSQIETISDAIFVFESDSIVVDSMTFEKLYNASELCTSAQQLILSAKAGP